MWGGPSGPRPTPSSALPAPGAKSRPESRLRTRGPPHNGLEKMRKMLLSLRQRESRLPVKVLQAHRLNDLETGSHHPAQHAEYLHLRYRTAVIGGETAAE